MGQPDVLRPGEARPGKAYLCSSFFCLLFSCKFVCEFAFKVEYRPGPALWCYLVIFVYAHRGETISCCLYQSFTSFFFFPQCSRQVICYHGNGGSCRAAVARGGRAGSSGNRKVAGVEPQIAPDEQLCHCVNGWMRQVLWSSLICQ